MCLPAASLARHSLLKALSESETTAASPDCFGRGADSCLMFPGSCDCRPCVPWCTATAGTRRQRGVCPRRLAGSSCDGQDFVADKVETNLRGAWLIEEECGGCFKHVLP